MRHFLAFSYNVHDSSVSLADERRVRLVLEAERFFGVKKKRCNFDEMEELIGVALAHAGIGIADVEGVSVTAYQNEHLPESRRDERWVSRCPVRVLGRSYDALVVNHHLSHAAMVHAFSDATNVVIDVCDGGGDFGDTHFIYRLVNGHIEALPNAPIHDAFSSRFYDIVSRHLYGRIMSEGKLMALASLGKPRDDMLAFVRENLRTFHAEPPETSLAALARRYPVKNYVTSSTAHDLAASVQTLFEALRVESVQALPADAPDVLLAGGATLNILANSAVKSSLAPGRRLLIPPCCDDTGQSLGALLYDCHEQRGLRLAADVPFLGYSDRIDDARLGVEDVDPELVSFLVAGGIVFLHRGQSEIGPRALGHRSIVALPTRRSYDLINHLIKKREFYRPLAPLVPLDQVEAWFEWPGESKFMLHAARVTDRTRLSAPGICHYDDSARLQTVDASEDPFLHRLLVSVGELTGCPLLINTSLNSQGAPIFSKLEQTRAFAREHSSLGVRVFHGGRFVD
ncbi:MAG TPA: carbamoyltransferase C-terminal domain-containing protein [Polyangiaceae bacterium]|nr:carbamoyltransferase C-terminal domain-containing protein [Polyangiaceae bacterium]